MTQFPIKEFEQIRTPFYYYDLNLLQKHLRKLKNIRQKRIIMFTMR